MKTPADAETAFRREQMMRSNAWLESAARHATVADDAESIMF